MRPRDAAALLRHAPQTVPFAIRLDVFQRLIAADRQRGKWDLAPAYGGPRPIAVSVQRGRAVECGMRCLGGVGAAIKGPLSVTYIDAHGRQVGVSFFLLFGFVSWRVALAVSNPTATSENSQECTAFDLHCTNRIQEAGIDHGGLLKEFLVESLLQGFDPKYGLFASVEGPSGGTLYPSPLAPVVEGGLAALRHMGIMLGKALYEGILVDMALATFFITRLQVRGKCTIQAELAMMIPVDTFCL